MGKEESSTGQDVDFNYEVNERVLCFHGPLMYEAKISNRKLAVDDAELDDGVYYFVHYKGWKSSWDEWVPEDRLLKFNEENIIQQKNLKQTYFVKNNGATDGPQKSQPDKEKDEPPRMNTAVFKFDIPEALKLVLVDEWEYITKTQRLLSLPRNPTVSYILDEYRISKTPSMNEKEKDEFIEFIKGLHLYFDKCLGTILLYRFERQQYFEVFKKHPNLPMSQIYGPEHLLRLIVKFPMLMASANVEEAEGKKIKSYLEDFVDYIFKNSKTWFSESNYDYATPEYISYA
ncbi:MRG-domain-containing protein, partial [Rozella allomycis CSF55]